MTVHASASFRVSAARRAAFVLLGLAVLAGAPSVARATVPAETPAGLPGTPAVPPRRLGTESLSARRLPPSLGFGRLGGQMGGRLVRVAECVPSVFCPCPP